MIKNIIKIRNIRKGIVLVGFLIYATMPVLANNNKAVQVSPQNEPSVKIIASDDNGALLTVQFENKNKSVFSLIIRDEAGNTMYRQKFDDTLFVKTFKIMNEETLPAKTTLTIAVEGGSEYVYDVNTTVFYIHNVAISKK